MYLGNQEGHPIKPELPTPVDRLDAKTLRPTVVATGMGGPDGVRTDMDGNVWITMGSGDANESGGSDRQDSHPRDVRGSTSIYSLFVEHVGAQVP